MKGITKNSKHLARDPFETSEFSIAWAKDHIIELAREIDTLLKDKNAYAYVSEPSSNGIFQMFKFKLRKPMSRPMRGHATDAVLNLRHALDQAICSVFACAGISKDNTYFPIARSLDELDRTLRKGWCKDLPPEISDILRRSKPYKGGNDLLWALNRLAGTNKHGILRPVVLSSALVEVTGFGMGVYIYDPPRWDGDKNELVLAKIPVDHECDINFNASFFIAFNQIEIVGGKEVISVFDKIVSMVEGIVMTIKAESKRIGLL